MSDLISRQAAIREYQEVCKGIKCGECPFLIKVNTEKGSHLITDCKLEAFLHDLPSAQPDIEKICTRIKAEAIKRNVEYMKHSDRYMIGFVDGMRLARRIVDGTIDDPVYFTLSEE